MRVEDVMTKKPLTADPDESARDALARMMIRGVSGLPVITRRNDEVVGVLSESDLLRLAGVADGQRNSWLADLFGAGDAIEGVLARFHEPVRSVMSVDVQAIDRSDTLIAAARKMERKHIRRLVVLDDLRLAGVLSRSDLTRALAQRIFTAERAF